MTTERLVYGELPDWGLVFIPEREALELARLYQALLFAETWGELKASITPGRWRQIISASFRDDEEPAPADDDPFDTGQLWGYGDGLWPEWPAQRQLAWMPKDIQQRFGEVDTGSPNGEALVIDAASEADVVAALRTASTTTTSSNWQAASRPGVAGRRDPHRGINADRPSAGRNPLSTCRSLSSGSPHRSLRFGMGTRSRSNGHRRRLRYT